MTEKREIPNSMVWEGRIETFVIISFLLFVLGSVLAGVGMLLFSVARWFLEPWTQGHYIAAVVLAGLLIWVSILLGLIIMANRTYKREVAERMEEIEALVSS